MAKTKEDKALELEARRTIYEFVVSSPGTHLREIQRQIDLPLGTVEYHLKYLVDKEMGPSCPSSSPHRFSPFLLSRSPLSRSVCTPHGVQLTYSFAEVPNHPHHPGRNLVK